MQKKISVFLITALLIAGFSLINLQQSTAGAAEVGTEIGMKAPDFSLTNLNDQKVNLSDYRGQKVFLNFWASWCPPCRAEMPDLEKLNQKYGAEVAVLAVNIGESKSTAANFIMENKLNLPVLLDIDKKTAQNYLVRAIPTTYILNEDGIIVEKTFGALSYQSMLKLTGIEE
ncbi:MAG: alkyl hydroperoxide reductase [Halanaerobium sp. 4-GBenrich]|jgi:peroxiredoxin|uniref:Peroxiredoxin n=1 Tax=Halanaerobium congolense TaxID=54121 RepID=A0A1G6R8K7_9FIRM|nr:TlpA disulfide reductase family protein [Halanaerobium congolense]KXS49428.1 MAG: alkyl hydroperoxide reductase [Halanaerobium sp. T82-1]ODS49639.1 MAG: alkyl hydroperoxide reductase [Halanaerobium sp. 4-GBenrich]OEG62151.1 MAG: alkyl hydroperoxide reductase [Halanaerobium sp. MDAL1]PUU92468.1 MAG: alkyl hydroperoxide reductase [Halanaerobium sp.]PXV63419.1 peroxiredoxin [Halanaerobium congolense]